MHIFRSTFHLSLQQLSGSSHTNYYEFPRSLPRNFLTLAAFLYKAALRLRSGLPSLAPVRLRRGGPFLFLYFSWALEARRSRRKRRERRVPRTRLLGEAPGDRIPSFTSFSRKIDSPKMRVLDSILRSTRRMERD